MTIDLRKWSLEDMSILMDLCNHVDRKYLSDRLPNPYTVKDASRWLNLVVQTEGIDGTYRSIVVDGEVVGSISVVRNNKFDGEIGFMLLTSFWNRGIMTYAVRQVSIIAFKELGLLRITANVFLPNEASQHVLQNNGFQLKEVKRNGVVKGKNVYDVCIYEMLNHNRSNHIIRYEQDDNQ